MNQKVTITLHGPTGGYLGDRDLTVTGVQFRDGMVIIQTTEGESHSSIRDLANPYNWQCTALSIITELKQTDMTPDEIKICEDIRNAVYRFGVKEARENYRPLGWRS